jgi:hypothetical protein
MFLKTNIGTNNQLEKKILPLILKNYFFDNEMLLFSLFTPGRKICLLHSGVMLLSENNC